MRNGLKEQIILRYVDFCLTNENFIINNSVDELIKLVQKLDEEIEVTEIDPWEYAPGTVKNLEVDEEEEDDCFEEIEDCPFCDDKIIRNYHNS